MLDMFLFETNQLIEQLEEIIIQCEKDKKLQEEDINEIFRIMHTIKGSSAMMMFNNISVLAHSLEDLFFFIRENKVTSIDFEKLSELVLSGIDFIKAEIEKLENFNEADGNSDALVENIKMHLSTMKGNENGAKEINLEENEEDKTQYYVGSFKGEPSSDKVTKYSVCILFEEDCEMENIRAYTVWHNIKDITTEIYYFPEDIMENNDSAEIIKKDGFLMYFATEKSRLEVEALLNQTAFVRSMEINEIEEYPEKITAPSSQEEDINVYNAEEKQKTYEMEPVNNKNSENKSKASKQQSIISVNISKLDMLMDLVGEIVISEAMVTRNPAIEALQLDSFNKAARQLRKLTNELQDIVMSIRMVPVSMTFHKMNRIVRDMSKKLNKEVELEIIGEETEVDKNIIDHLSDPLMHLIRNSVDHGLEDRETRMQSGKPEKGKITLEARSEGGDVWIVIKDDGKGMNREKILSKAKENGLLTKNSNELTDKEVFSFILLPGFSTKEKVTEFSGRGVGMDVVKKNIDSIGGSIVIDSTEGEGTTIVIKIPLTLAIIDGMEIAVGKTKYTIPTTSIRESFKPSAKDVTEDCDGNEIIMIRGQCYPVLRIHRAFNIQTEITSIEDGIMVMVDGDLKSACIFADRLLGEQQVVVKALPKYIKKVKGIVGCTILGDGSISLIIDVNGVLERL
ncbi:chemotaxis protein CheA [Clostridium carboxidivorans P7]|uniref:Chemotaxis protein CheA n=1 Tax=Clostridium carboxidivorans P7 TaxID=536227 RepID=C6PXU2_9CLOT|nr:chemotaxis protein CheA [Clostridium carboxidivorans]AKN34180.1 chemotaxis protein CheA [Clostridium carboxidivorans P7]EET85930.1 CheA signal transduction histidine kinase [Clostridium carboxidivorans P7]